MPVYYSRPQPCVCRRVKCGLPSLQEPISLVNTSQTCPPASQVSGHEFTHAVQILLVCHSERPRGSLPLSLRREARLSESRGIPECVLCHADLGSCSRKILGHSLRLTRNRKVYGHIIALTLKLLQICRKNSFAIFTAGRIITSRTAAPNPGRRAMKSAIGGDTR